MNSQIALDMLGYTSSIIILISMLMSSVVKLRIINSIGTTIFTVYAILSLSVKKYEKIFVKRPKRKSKGRLCYGKNVGGTLLKGIGRAGGRFQFFDRGG